MSTDIPAGFELRHEDNTFMDRIGPVYQQVLPDRVRLGTRLTRHQLNPGLTTHGGMLMSLLDVTFGSTAAQVLGHEGIVATVSMTCNMLAAAREGEWIQTDAQVDKTTKTLSFISGRITSGDRVLATATGVFRNPPPPKPEGAGRPA
jgi:uncharacterized protein (TIGR00369 family)